MKSSIPDGLVYWNDNLLCAVDTETTGLDPEKHEILEIAIVPLNRNFEVNHNYVIFNMTMAPRKPLDQIDQKAMDVNKLDLARIINSSVPSASAVDIFETWFENLGLKPGKQIIPLAHNWPFDRGFIIDWMGPLHYDKYFSRYYRDNIPIANFMNDRANAVDGFEVVFPQQALQKMANKLGVENPSPHRAIGDAVTAARIYCKLMRMPC